jgi:hypothetical protein
MSLIAKGNTVCILLGVSEKQKPGLKNVFKAPSGKVYGNSTSKEITTSRNIIGKIEDIDGENCTIRLGNYKRGVGFIPYKDEVTYSIDYLRELERSRYIKLLV